MEKPLWRRRSSRYVIDSPHLRLRSDEIELPDGTIVPEYFVRESEGFVVVAAITEAAEVVMVREYRYGSDRVHLDLPAGTIAPGEHPAACAARELAEETGYVADRLELVAAYHAEPVRSTAQVRVFLGYDARLIAQPRRDPSECMEVELLTLEGLRRGLADGSVDSGASIAAGYRVLDALGRL